MGPILRLQLRSANRTLPPGASHVADNPPPNESGRTNRGPVRLVAWTIKRRSSGQSARGKSSTRSGNEEPYQVPRGDGRCTGLRKRLRS
jgi:hypothetical protein